MTLASISARPSRLDDVAGIIAERANPLAVRMVRQHLRSMGFIAVFTLLLFTALVTAILAATLPQAEAFGRGRWLYGILLAIWSACAVVAQPLMLVSAVRDERADSCWELLDLTGLHPLTVLSGMAWAAAVQQAVLMSAMAPFLIMAWLLRGLDPLLLLLTLLIVPIMGLTVTCMGMRGACSARKARFAGSALAYLLFLILIWLVMMWMLWASLHWRTLEEIAGLLRSGHAGAWATLAFLTMIALQAGMMGLVRAAMRISHPAGNRSTAPRALTWLCVGSFLVLLLALATFTRLTWSEALGWFAIIVAVRTMLSGSDALSEPYPLTPKQANWGTQWHGWRRPGFALLRPGAAAGRRCFLALAVLSLACGGVAWRFPAAPMAALRPWGRWRSASSAMPQSSTRSPMPLRALAVARKVIPDGIV